MSRKLKIDSESNKKTKWSLTTSAINSSERFRGSRMEIISNCEICVEGCLGVLEYTDAYIKLNLCKGAVIILGSCLDISYFEGNTITVRGKLSSLEFCI